MRHSVTTIEPIQARAYIPSGDLRAEEGVVAFVVAQQKMRGLGSMEKSMGMTEDHEPITKNILGHAAAVGFRGEFVSEITHASGQTDFMYRIEGEASEVRRWFAEIACRDFTVEEKVADGTTAGAIDFCAVSVDRFAMESDQRGKRLVDLPGHLMMRLDDERGVAARAKIGLPRVGDPTSRYEADGSLKKADSVRDHNKKVRAHCRVFRQARREGHSSEEARRIADGAYDSEVLNRAAVELRNAA